MVAILVSNIVNETGGYKCFNHGLINRYGKKFELNKVYHADPPIKFGNKGNGFHMCKHLEDTLKFFDAKNELVDITKVTCFGEFDEIPNTYENEYNDNYDMYAYEYMIIDQLLTRNEIISYILKIYDERVKKFLMYYRLTEEEIALFRRIYKNNETINAYIDYYQQNQKDAFIRRRTK